MKYSTERWSTNLINVKNKKQKQKQKQKTSKQTKLKKTNRKKQRKQNIEKKEEEEKPFMNSNHLTQKTRHMSMYIQVLAKNWHVFCGVKPITESLRKV
jgi:hypothetical protein